VAHVRMELWRHAAHVHPQHPIRVQGDELVLATGKRGVHTDGHAANYAPGVRCHPEEARRRIRDPRAAHEMQILRRLRMTMLMSQTTLSTALRSFHSGNA